MKKIKKSNNMNQVLGNDKKDLIILDFDDTMYYNPKNNFSIDINPNKIIEAQYFFGEFVKQVGIFDHRNIQFLLLTGRDREQKEVILYHLRSKGYKIDNAIFINFYNAYFPDSIQYYDDSSFMIKYWHWKAQIIDQLRLSNEYRSITIIDNDDIICAMLRELDMTIIKVKIESVGNGLRLHFTNFNPVQIIELANW